MEREGGTGSLTELLLRVAAVVVFGSFDGSTVTLDGDFTLAGARLVVVVGDSTRGNV